MQQSGKCTGVQRSFVPHLANKNTFVTCELQMRKPRLTGSCNMVHGQCHNDIDQPTHFSGTNPLTQTATVAGVKQMLYGINELLASGLVSC